MSELSRSASFLRLCFRHTKAMRYSSPQRETESHWTGLSHNISITSANPFHDYVFVFTFCILGCRLSTDFSAVVLPQHLSPKIAPSEIIKTTLRKPPMTNCPAPIIYMVRRLQPTLPVHKYSSSFIFTSGILIHHLCLLTMMMIHIAMGMMMMDEPPFHYIVMMKPIVTAR